MDISVYDLTVPQFIQSLNALKRVLKKAQGFADSKKVDMSVLLQTRLAPDQFPLSRQIQIATDNAKACAARLSGTTAPVFEDKETTIEEFHARIDKTIAYLETVKSESFKNYKEIKVTFPWVPNMYLDGKSYLVQHALPNFYFHVTTAYSILRASGVDLGKVDFLNYEKSWKPL